MIVFPNAVVLSPPDSVPLYTPRVGYQSFARARDAFSVTVSTEDPSGPRDAPLRPDTAEYWLPTALPATWELDLGASQTVDYIAVAGHTIGTAAASIAASTSPDLVTAYSAFGGTAVTPADDTPIMFVDVPTSVRRVKLTLTGGAVKPQIAVIYAGKLLSMPKGLALGWQPLTMSRQTTLQQSMSRSGQFLGQSYRRNGVHATAKFDNLTESWYRSYFDPFVKNARLYPYFFAWNPQVWPLEVGYVWTPDDIVPSYAQSNVLSVQWQMFGIGNA
jgi:hypothetical protein